jgi:hypothetical protein
MRKLQMGVVVCSVVGTLVLGSTVHARAATVDTPEADANPKASGGESTGSAAPGPAVPAEPFAWGDFTWLNGTNRQHASLLDSKYFTGTFTMDVNYNYSFNRPIDHTNVGSTATFREGELNLSFAAFGGDFHYGNARGRLLLQLGTRATGVPRNDLTPLRGQFDLYTALRYISEAYAGYHWDVLHGINLDVGMFMSYVGLMSYNNFENWVYQPSYTSDNTPWFQTNILYMPNQYSTWSLELVYRRANVPYFAGRGGVTSPTGWNPPIGDPIGFEPDLVKAETRLIFSVLFRM